MCFIIPAVGKLRQEDCTFKNSLSFYVLTSRLVWDTVLGFHCCEQTPWSRQLLERKHLIGAGLQFQRFSPLSSQWEAWQCAGRLGAGEGAESSISPFKCSQKEGLSCTGQFERRTSEPTPHSDALPPTRPRLLTVPFPIGQRLSNHHRG